MSVGFRALGFAFTGAMFRVLGLYAFWDIRVFDCTQEAFLHLRSLPESPKSSGIESYNPNFGHKQGYALTVFPWHSVQVLALL